MNNYNMGENSNSFFTVKKEDRAGWLTKTLDTLMEEGQERIRCQRENLMGYLGIETDIVPDITTRREYNYRSGRRRRKFKINHLFDIIETRVAKFTKLKTNVLVKPTHPDWGDRGAAEVSKHVINHIFEKQSLDAKTIETVRSKEVLGESYLFVEWDKDEGDLHPAYTEAINNGLTEVPDPNGGTIKISKENPIKVGDVKLSTEFPWRVFLQRKEKYEDVDYCFRVKIIELDKVEKMYPKYKGQFKQATGVSVWDIDLLEERYMENHVAVYEFYHRKTKELPNGFHAIFCDGLMLMEEDLPYEHGKLPMVRLTDIEIPGYINGIAKFTQALTIQERCDDINTMIVKNMYFMSHPKFAVPRGSVDIRQLGNDNTIVEWTGAPPTVLQAQANNGEVYKYRPSVIQEMERFLNMRGLSSNEAPKGITAASALALLNEEESIRFSPDISKYSQFVRDVARLVLSTAGQYYLPTDDRLVKIVGEDASASIRFFDAADLSKPYDVQFENSSGFPESVAYKRQKAIEIMQYAGEKAPIERLLDYLDMNSPESINNFVSAAVRTADSENQDLLAGRPVSPPEPTEDLITKWESRFAMLNQRHFKDQAPNYIYIAILENVKQIEELMLDKAAKSPIFEAQLARLVHFPLINHAGFMPPKSQEQQQAIVQGQANRGEEVTEQIAPEPKAVEEK